VIGFQLGQASDVTVLVLKADGTIVRQIARPARAVGKIAVPYYGYDGSGHRLPAGTYQVLIVASNATGSSTVQTTLTLDAA
jgi:flagellar hook assembly protein FlgD